MKKTLLVQNSFDKKTFYRFNRKTSSAFGIPEELVPVLNRKILQHKGLRSYLRSLLTKLRSKCYDGQLPQGNGVKTRYQEEGLNLQYFSFKPDNGDWSELRLLAFAHGVSMTQFFVFLLKLDNSEVGEKLLKSIWVKVPTLFLKKPIRLVANLYRLSGERELRIKFGKKKYEWKEIQKPPQPKTF